MNARDIVAAALTAAREPEYGIPEQADYDDADIAVAALEQAGIIQTGAPIASDATGLDKRDWIASLMSLFLRMGIPEDQVRAAITEAMLVFEHSELTYGIRELEEVSEGIEDGAEGYFGLSDSQKRSILAMLAARSAGLHSRRIRTIKRINAASSKS